MRMPQTGLLLAWAGPEDAWRYDASRLSAADQARAGQRRSAGALADWRVSRALMQHCLPSYPDAAFNLSHSAGHACLALAPTGVRVGVDIERLRPRRLESVADWAFSCQERAWLTALPPARALRAFYVLWTLKEALIKAGGLDFPADLRKVGLSQTADLRAPGGDWRAVTLWLAGGWAVSAAWEAPPVCTRAGAAVQTAAASACRWAVGRRSARALAGEAGLHWLPGPGKGNSAMLALACWGTPGMPGAEAGRA